MDEEQNVELEETPGLPLDQGLEEEQADDSLFEDDAETDESPDEPGTDDTEVDNKTESDIQPLNAEELQKQIEQEREQSQQARIDLRRHIAELKERIRGGGEPGQGPGATQQPQPQSATQVDNAAIDKEMLNKTQYKVLLRQIRAQMDNGDITEQEALQDWAALRNDYLQEQRERHEWQTQMFTNRGESTRSSVVNPVLNSYGITPGSEEYEFAMEAFGALGFTSPAEFAAADSQQLETLTRMVALATKGGSVTGLPLNGKDAPKPKAKPAAGRPGAARQPATPVNQPARFRSMKDAFDAARRGEI